MKVLITGSSGFIFGNFIRLLFFNKVKWAVTSIDRIRNKSALYSVYTNKDHDFYPADIRDRHIIDNVFSISKPDIVIHGAAESFVDESISSASDFITSNVLGTQNIIDMCIQHDVSRLVYMSTDEVACHTTDSEIKFDESATLNPRNPYSASKASGELLIKAANQTHGLKYQIVRCANNYGPWQDNRKIIPKIVKNIIEKRKVPIYGDGSNLRDWIYVSDTYSAIMKIIESGNINEVYNISAGQEISNIELFQLVCNQIGRGHELLEFVEDRKGHDYRYGVDSSKLCNLGWNPQYKIKHGLEQTINWYLNNKWFLK